MMALSSVSAIDGFTVVVEIEWCVLGVYGWHAWKANQNVISLIHVFRLLTAPYNVGMNEWLLDGASAAHWHTVET